MQPNDDGQPTHKEPRLPSNNNADGSVQGNPAAAMIRQKLDKLYAEEPAAKDELRELVERGKPRSKHQVYMQKLSTSGMSLAEIQTAWHNYYQSLPDVEKHQVWQEFYAQHEQASHVHQVQSVATASSVAPVEVETTPEPTVKKPRKVIYNKQTVADIKKELSKKVRTRGKLKAKQHFQSLLFGVSMGAVVMLILLFGFFNDRFIAPFITPSRQVSSTPIIIDQSAAAVGSQSEIIIPKINVEIPVVYDEPSVNENAIENALERGVVHYATTPAPGEIGNVVIFGHSSNNIFNKGKYKFAFVLLSRLENGDVFYLTKGGTRYAYQVYKKSIVSPTDVSVMGPADKPDTATLITCDPPGTSINRLVVTAQQISPDPTGNKASTAIKSSTQPTVIPSNSPSLWSRLVNWLFH